MHYSTPRKEERRPEPAGVAGSFSLASPVAGPLCAAFFISAVTRVLWRMVDAGEAHYRPSSWGHSTFTPTNCDGTAALVDEIIKRTADHLRIPQFSELRHREIVSQIVEDKIVGIAAAGQFLCWQNGDEVKTWIRGMCGRKFDDPEARFVKEVSARSPIVGATTCCLLNDLLSGSSELSRRNSALVQWYIGAIDLLSRTHATLVEGFEHLDRKLSEGQHELRAFLSAWRNDLITLLAETANVANTTAITLIHYGTAPSVLYWPLFPKPDTIGSDGLRALVRKNLPPTFLAALPEVFKQSAFEANEVPIPVAIDRDDLLEYLNYICRYFKVLGNALKQCGVSKGNSPSVYMGVFEGVPCALNCESSAREPHIRVHMEYPLFRKFSLRLDADTRYGPTLDFGSISTMAALFAFFAKSKMHAGWGRDPESTIGQDSVAGGNDSKYCLPLAKRVALIATAIGKAGALAGTSSGPRVGHHMREAIATVSAARCFREIVPQFRELLLRPLS